MSEIVVAEAPKPALLRPVAQPSDILVAHKEATTMINEVLEDGRDYGVIPGTGDKKNLLKPGAERLCIGYGLRASYEVIEKETDHDRSTPFTVRKWVAKKQKPANWEELKAQGLGRNKQYNGSWQWQEPVDEAGTSDGLYRFVIRCTLVSGDGREVGQGIGSCSSLESKYIRQPRDSENTVLKMAKKRAYVDAVLTTLGLSDRFTQDVEDIEANKKASPVDAEVVDAEYTEAPTEDPPTKVTDPLLAHGGCNVSKAETKELNQLYEAKGGDKQELWVRVYNLGLRGYAQIKTFIAQLPDPKPTVNKDDPNWGPNDNGYTMFGYRPIRFPLASMFKLADEGRQGQDALIKAGVPECDVDDLFAAIFVASELADQFQDSVGHQMIVADFAENAPRDQLKAALAHVDQFAALGDSITQEALLV